ncbi:MAG TPA: hypothetical protein VE262_19980 [Blastocatellia bacterium]|nr:hypothetical protein [Blastocatellia bacterium]
MSKTARLSALPALALLLLAADKSVACSCANGTSTPESFKYASDVFAGRVIEVSPPKGELTHYADGSVGVSFGTGPGVVRLSVERSYKGTQGSEVQFDYHHDGCDYPFEAGGRYLVYANLEDGKLKTDKCKRTRPLAKAAPDLKYIGGLERNEPQATIYGYVFRRTIGDKGEPGLQTPFEELTVIAEGEKGQVVTQAEKWGEYEVTLPPGKYRVWVEREGVTVSKPDEIIVLKDGDCERLSLPATFDGTKPRSPELMYGPKKNIIARPAALTREGGLR